LSYHHDAGAQVVDTVTAADSAVLFPVQDGAADKCRRANIKFACVQLNLDFSALVTLRPPGNTIFCAKYYIEFPQDSCNMTVASNQAYHLTNYLGPGDLQAMAAEEFQRDILGITLQDGPVDFLSPRFNHTLVRMDRTTLVSEIPSKIIMLAIPFVLKCLFNQLCPPGYSKEHHAALDHIQKMYEDAEGDTIFQLVFDYYTQFLGASCPFVDQDPLPISICQVFIDGLDSLLITGFCSHFPNYRVLQALTATHQRKTLEAMMQAAVKAKTEFTNIRTIASEAMGGTPAKHFKPRSMSAKLRGHLPSMALGMTVPTPQVDNAEEAPFAATDLVGPTLGLSLMMEPM
jgi:hypothetical protein